MSEQKRERRLIPAHELHAGSRVYVELHQAQVQLPQRPRLRPDGIDVHIPEEGQWITVSDWILGAVKRGDLVAYDDVPPAPRPTEELKRLREEVLKANESREKAEAEVAQKGSATPAESPPAHEGEV